MLFLFLFLFSAVLGGRALWELKHSVTSERHASRGEVWQMLGLVPWLALWLLNYSARRSSSSENTMWLRIAKLWHDTISFFLSDLFMHNNSKEKLNQVAKQWREQNIFFCVQQKKETYTGL